MNRSSQRLTKRQAEQKAHRMMGWVHVLIAVVAIIECMLLISFTTFSWIESNSSLIIQNGPESSQVNTQITKKMDIAKRLSSTINLNYSETGVADNDFPALNEFFSEVKYFEFANATSSDGLTMFFPCRNNTYSEAGKYRKGDTIDYNTSYLYFDFVVSNRTHDGGPDPIENRDVYFDNTEGYTDIFTVTGDDLTSTQKTALENAMRMSITTQASTGGAAVTKILAKKAYSGATGYQSFDVENIPAEQSYAYDVTTGGHTNQRNKWVETRELAKSVYHTSNNVIDSDKLFVVKKNAETKVSFRIWLEYWDPDFRSAFGLDSLDYNGYEDGESDYWKIPNATVGIKFRLKTSGNDLRSIYFDDYTFTNNTGINIYHLTDENPSYSVWFYAYQPYVAASLDHPERTAGYYKIKLERESRDATHTLWSANTATASEMEYLMNLGEFSDAPDLSGSARYQKSYFCYGDFDTNTAIYRWELPAAPRSDDFVFNAYSYMPNSSYTPASSANGWSDCTGLEIKRGVGLWQDDADSTLTLLKFKDMATAVTETDYNDGPNYQIMNAQAVADNHSYYLVYANNYNNNTLANNFTDDVAKITAAMYYDAAEQVFKSYVPTGWLTDDEGNVSFTYCPGGVFSASGATLRWCSAPALVGGEYQFTALGYSNRFDKTTALEGLGYTASFFNGSDGFMNGVGTWGNVELIRFNTDLIDNYLNSSYRYFVGIDDTYSKGYYAMVPDAAHMTFWAYIPAEEGKTTAGKVNFVRFDNFKNSNNDDGPSAYWYGNVRGTYGTFYPVDIVSTPADPKVYTRGYWNLSVLVDGTYENLIYDTLTDGAHDGNDDPVATYAPIVTNGTKTVTISGTPTALNNDSVDYTPRDNYGKLEYSYDNQNWVTLADDTTDTLYNCLDRYRFFVPAEGYSTVYWRWTPYKGYMITFDRVDESQNPPVSEEKTVNAEDTQFEYTHDVTDASSSGIYKVVIEAPDTT